MQSLDWYLYTSEDLNCSILFPSKPQAQVKNIITELGDVKQTTAFTLSQDSSNIEYQLISSKYTSELFESEKMDSSRLLIQSTIINEMRAFLDGKIIYENEAELNGIPCYWFLIKYRDHLALKSCLIWDKNNLISLIHYSEYEKRLDSNSERFFNSFELF